MEIEITIFLIIVWSRYDTNTIKISSHRAEAVAFAAQVADPVNKRRDNQMAWIS